VLFNMLMVVLILLQEAGSASTPARCMHRESKTFADAGFFLQISLRCA
jgi:hypothetical protein